MKSVSQITLSTIAAGLMMLSLGCQPPKPPAPAPSETEPAATDNTTANTTAGSETPVGETPVDDVDDVPEVEETTGEE